MPLTNRFVIMLATIALGVTPRPTVAQEELATQDSSIEQITITSQKRETLPQETPISVPAFTGADLEGALLPGRG